MHIGFIMLTKGIFAMKSQNYSMKQYLNGQIFIYLQIMCSKENRERLAVDFRRVLSEIWGSCNLS